MSDGAPPWIGNQAGHLGGHQLSVPRGRLNGVPSRFWMQQ